VAGQCDQREGQQSVPYGQTVVPEEVGGQGEQGSMQGGVQTGNSMVYTHQICTASLSRCFKVYTGFWSLFSLSRTLCALVVVSLSLSF
jgi:hypothetical protein